MAAIDKFYVKSWEEYMSVFNLFKTFGKVKDDFGNIFDPIRYIRHYTKEKFDEVYNNMLESNEKTFLKCKDSWVEHGYMTQEEADNYKPEDHVSIFIMNTPVYFDIWMIRNCQENEYLQRELKDKYGGGWSKAAFTNHNDEDLYEQILNKTSVYDTYKRNGLGKNIRVDMSPLKRFKPWGLDRIHLDIQVRFDEDEGFVDYHPDEDMWYHDLEQHQSKDWTTNHAHFKYMSRKAIFRKLQKWNLPENAEVCVQYWVYIGKKRFVETYYLNIKKSKRYGMVSCK